MTKLLPWVVVIALLWAIIEFCSGTWGFVTGHTGKLTYADAIEYDSSWGSQSFDHEIFEWDSTGNVIINLTVWGRFKWFGLHLFYALLGGAVALGAMVFYKKQAAETPSAVGAPEASNPPQKRRKKRVTKRKTPAEIQQP